MKKYNQEINAYTYPMPKEPEYFTEIRFLLHQKVDETGQHIIREILKDGFERYISFHESSISIKEL